ncbi:hypothetical protein JCM6882_003255 [Rhodosporidiobolus microsporus]
MHSFFTTGFEPLRALVVDLLAEDGVHSLLPLLGVNHEWRKLAGVRMLQEYYKTKILRFEGGGEFEMPVPVLSEGEYILLEECGCSPYDGPFVTDDPRSTLSKARSKEVRKRSSPLFLSAFDPATSVCTFRPKELDGVDFHILCDMDHNEFRDLPRSFDFHPTGWFRSAGAGATAALDGLELAARPDRHPPVCEQVLTPNIPSKPKTVEPMEMLMDPVDGGFKSLNVKDYKMRCGWTVSYNVGRFDIGTADMTDLLDDMVMVPCHLSVKELKVPFIDLFVPRRSTKEKGWYD